MRRPGIQLAVSAGLLLLLGVTPAHWWSGPHRSVGLLHERSCLEPDGHTECVTTRLDQRYEGWWPRAGKVTYIGGMAAVGLLAIAALLAVWRAPIPFVGLLAALACVVVGLGAMMFFFGRPAELAHERFDMGFALTLVGALVGAVGGTALWRSHAADAPS